MSVVASDQQIEDVAKVLNDSNRPLKERFRALFTLRNLGGSKAVEGIAACFSDTSALLKHELAYCLGQMQDLSAVPVLTTVLQNVEQEAMVRHEAGMNCRLSVPGILCAIKNFNTFLISLIGEALGAIGSPESISVLEAFCKDVG